MQAELLTEPHNYAVVQLPGRKFPGVVFQGDSLNALIENIRQVAQQLETGDVPTASEELGFIQEQLAQVRSGYEKVCAAKGLGLPYPTV